METLEVIARPHFDADDAAWLKDIRERRAGSRGPPYFTLVFFPGSDLTPHDFAEHVRAVAQATPRIRFRLRSALVAPEPTVARFHVFLAPDEGFGAIQTLHDALHTGPVEPALHQERPYLPHVTVATESSFAEARAIARSLNNGGIDIIGHIDALEIERRSGDVVRTVGQAPLAKAGWFA